MEPLPFEVPADFAAATDEQLSAAKQNAFTHAAPLRAKIKELTAAEKDQLRAMFAVVQSVDAELAKRQKEADELTAADQGFAAMDPAAQTPPAAVPAPAAGNTMAAGEVPQAPAAAAVPRARDLVAAGTVPAVNAPAAVTPNYGGFVYQTKAGPTEFSGLVQLASEAMRNFGRYDGSQGQYMKDPLLHWRREFPEELRGPAIGLGDSGVEFNLVANAVDQFVSQGGNIVQDGNQVAGATYCAPSQTIYDLCEMETASGILPITEIQISRGGIFFTTGPDFASIFNGAGYWNYTEVQIAAETIKPCMEIECPPFTEQRLRNLGVCITGGILQRRGFPELIARFIRGAMISHLHRINAFVIAQMAAGSTLVDLDPIPVGSLVGDNTSSGLLAALEMVATDIRYRNRLDPEATIDAVGPLWVLPQLRADVSRRTGVDMISVTNSRIRSWFADRNLNLILVYDWQDAFSGVAGGPGAAAPGITSFASTVEFLLYPPKTWVKGVDDTIRLETVYDSVNLGVNKYTALFTEEGVLVAKVCPDSRRVVYPLCPTGATTQPVARTCA